MNKASHLETIIGCMSSDENEQEMGNFELHAPEKGINGLGESIEFSRQLSYGSNIPNTGAVKKPMTGLDLVDSHSNGSCDDDDNSSSCGADRYYVEGYDFETEVPEKEDASEALSGIIDVSTIADICETDTINITFSQDAADNNSAPIPGQKMYLDIPDLISKELKAKQEAIVEEPSEGSSGVGTSEGSATSSVILNVFNEDFEGNPDPETYKKILRAKHIPRGLDPWAKYQIQREKLVMELKELEAEDSSQGSCDMLMRRHCAGGFFDNADDSEIDVDIDIESVHDMTEDEIEDDESSDLLDRGDLNFKKPKTSQYALIPDNHYRPDKMNQGEDLVLMLPKNATLNNKKYVRNPFLPVQEVVRPEELEGVSDDEDENKGYAEKEMEYTLQKYDSTPHRIAELVLKNIDAGKEGAIEEEYDSETDDADMEDNCDDDDELTLSPSTPAFDLSQFALKEYRVPEDDDLVDADRSVVSIQSLKNKDTSPTHSASSSVMSSDSEGEVDDPNESKIFDLIWTSDQKTEINIVDFSGLGNDYNDEKEEDNDVEEEEANPVENGTETLNSEGVEKEDNEGCDDLQHSEPEEKCTEDHEITAAVDVHKQIGQTSETSSDVESESNTQVSQEDNSVCEREEVDCSSSDKLREEEILPESDEEVATPLSNVPAETPAVGEANEDNDGGKIVEESEPNHEHEELDQEVANPSSNMPVETPAVGEANEDNDGGKIVEESEPNHEHEELDQEVANPSSNMPVETPAVGEANEDNDGGKIVEETEPNHEHEELDQEVATPPSNMPVETPAVGEANDDNDDVERSVEESEANYQDQNVVSTSSNMPVETPTSGEADDGERSVEESRANHREHEESDQEDVTPSLNMPGDTPVVKEADDDNDGERNIEDSTTHHNEHEESEQEELGQEVANPSSNMPVETPVVGEADNYNDGENIVEESKAHQYERKESQEVATSSSNMLVNAPVAGEFDGDNDEAGDLEGVVLAAQKYEVKSDIDCDVEKEVISEIQTKTEDDKEDEKPVSSLGIGPQISNDFFEGTFLNTYEPNSPKSVYMANNNEKKTEKKETKETESENNENKEAIVACPVSSPEPADSALVKIITEETVSNEISLEDINKENTISSEKVESSAKVESKISDQHQIIQSELLEPMNIAAEQTDSEVDQTNPGTFSELMCEKARPIDLSLEENEVKEKSIKEEPTCNNETELESVEEKEKIILSQNQPCSNVEFHESNHQVESEFASSESDINIRKSFDDCEKAQTDELVPLSSVRNFDLDALTSNKENIVNAQDFSVKTTISNMLSENPLMRSSSSSGSINKTNTDVTAAISSETEDILSTVDSDFAVESENVCQEESRMTFMERADQCGIQFEDSNLNKHQEPHSSSFCFAVGSVDGTISADTENSFVTANSCSSGTPKDSTSRFNEQELPCHDETGTQNQDETVSDVSGLDQNISQLLDITYEDSIIHDSKKESVTEDSKQSTDKTNEEGEAGKVEVPTVGQENVEGSVATNERTIKPIEDEPDLRKPKFKIPQSPSKIGSDMSLLKMSGMKLRLKAPRSATKSPLVSHQNRSRSSTRKIVAPGRARSRNHRAQKTALESSS